MDFMECDTCRAKPGTPVLCSGCLHNRAAIGNLKRARTRQHNSTGQYVDIPSYEVGAVDGYDAGYKKGFTVGLSIGVISTGLLALLVLWCAL